MRKEPVADGVHSTERSEIGVGATTLRAVVAAPPREGRTALEACQKAASSNDCTTPAPGEEFGLQSIAASGAAGELRFWRARARALELELDALRAKLLILARRLPLAEAIRLEREPESLDAE